MDIGSILKERRLRREETLEGVAFRAGTDAGNLSRIERNRQDVSVQRLGRLCAALEWSLAELFEELEVRSRVAHLHDPSGAFDADTRNLLALMKNLSPASRKLLVEIARLLERDPAS